MCQHCDFDDDLLKANPGGDEWRPHESPFIRDLIEKWTNHGMEAFGKAHAEVLQWVSGVFHKPAAAKALPPGNFARWSPAELAAAKLYLESIPPEAYSLDDWMMVIDYIVQKYLPADVMMADANWQVAKASMMGRVQASMPTISAALAGKIAVAMPFDVEVIDRRFGMMPSQAAAIKFGQVRCCQYVTNVTEGLRGAMKLAIVEWQHDKFLGTPSAIAKQALQSKLLDSFGVANRDWRRIALTELSDNSMNGFLASLPLGSRVKRVEMYTNACAFCRSIDGREFTLVSPDKEEKNGETEMWVGKSNYGRSSAPNKKTPNGLVPRTAAERWWVPAGPVHPHCRGIWIKATKPVPGADPAFAAWLKQHFAKKEKTE